jgi:hypothetical protein
MILTTRWRAGHTAGGCDRCRLGRNDRTGRWEIATKRVLRVVVKATDFCFTEPARIAQRIVDGGFTARLSRP